MMHVLQLSMNKLGSCHMRHVYFMILMHSVHHTAVDVSVTCFSSSAKRTMPETQWTQQQLLDLGLSADCVVLGGRHMLLCVIVYKLLQFLHCCLLHNNLKVDAQTTYSQQHPCVTMLPAGFR